MATTVGQHQQADYTTPQNGDPGDAAVVLSNDNTTVNTYNSHDNDPGIHFQSSAASSRPSASTSGRKWFITDTRRIQYDTGGAWVNLTVDAGDISSGTIADARLTTSSVGGSSGLLNPGATINGVLFNGTTNINITASSADPLTLGAYLTGGSYDGSAPVTTEVDATSTNTASKVVARDASGNFAATIITANLTGNVTGNLTGNASGNASTATALANARTIGGVSFNGSANITVETATNGFTVSGGSSAAGKIYSTSAFGWALRGRTGSIYDFLLEDAASTVAVLANPTGTINLTAAGSITATGGFVGALTGLASSASILNPGRTINGVAFNGSTDITITAANPQVLTIGTHLTGTSYDGSAPITIATDAVATNTVSTIVSRDGSGNFAAGTITAALSGNASTATALANARTIGGVSFDGTANITVETATNGFTVSGGSSAAGKIYSTSAFGWALRGRTGSIYDFLLEDAASTVAVLANPTGTINLTAAGTITAAGFVGNASTATSAATLTTARTIGGVSFNGSANITVSSATGGFAVTGGNLTSAVLSVTGSTAVTASTDIQTIVGANFLTFSGPLAADNTARGGGYTAVGYGATPRFYGIGHSGTVTSPLALTNGAGMGSYNGGGWDGTAYAAIGASLNLQTNEAWSVGNHGTQAIIRVTPNGTTSTIAAVTVNGTGTTFASNVVLAGTLSGVTTIGLNGVTYTWPGTSGTNGYVLTTNGSGTLSWSAAGAGTVTGSGTTAKYPKWSSSSALTDGNLREAAGFLISDIPLHVLGVDITVSKASSSTGMFITNSTSITGTSWFLGAGDQSSGFSFQNLSLATFVYTIDPTNDRFAFHQPFQVAGDTTGSGTALGFGTNCPASTLTAPYTWVKMISSDGSTVYTPAYK